MGFLFPQHNARKCHFFRLQGGPFWGTHFLSVLDQRPRVLRTSGGHVEKSAGGLDAVVGQAGDGGPSSPPECGRTSRLEGPRGGQLPRRQSPTFPPFETDPPTRRENVIPFMKRMISFAE